MRALAALNAPGTTRCAVFDPLRPRFISRTRDYAVAITVGDDPASYNAAVVRVVKADRTLVDLLGFTGPGTADADIRSADVSRTGERSLLEMAPKASRPRALSPSWRQTCLRPPERSPRPHRARSVISRQPMSARGSHQAHSVQETAAAPRPTPPPRTPRAGRTENACRGCQAASCTNE
jgi:hypothetical protein